MNYIKYALKRKTLPVSFIDDNHTYRHGLKELKSVTTLISEYCKPFDANGYILKAVAESKGITTTELSNIWAKNRDDSCEFGTKIHDYAEQYSLGLPVNGKLPDKELGYLQQVIKFFKDYKLKVVDSEILVYSLDYGVAGQIDLVSLNDKGELELWDWKTGKSIDTDNKYNEFMLYDLAHVSDNNYNKYALQMSSYIKLLRDWGFKVSDTCHIIHLQEQDYKVYDVKYMPECEIIFKG